MGLLFFRKMAAGGHFGDRKSLSITFLAILDQYATLILKTKITKWLPIAFLAISDQYTTFFSKWPPAAILEVRYAPKTLGFFHYVLSMAMPNMKLIGEFMTQLETPQAF